MTKNITKKEILPWVQELDDNFMSQRGTLKVKQARALLNKRMFRVADTFLTYRQINFLDADGLLEENRKEKNNWRKFSIKELVYLSLIKELRFYGVANKQLKDLNTIFFSEGRTQRTEENLLSALRGKKIVLVLKNKCGFFFYNLPNYVIFHQRVKSHININLNEIVFEILDKIGRKGIDYKDELYFMTKRADATKKEESILNFIRDKGYKSITIKNNKDEEYLVKGEKIKAVDEKELLKMIKEKKFADINIVKRDGNIVNIKVEEIFKI